MATELKVGGSYIWRKREITLHFRDGERAGISLGKDPNIRLVNAGELEPLPDVDFAEHPVMQVEHGAWARAEQARNACEAILACKTGRRDEVEEQAEILGIGTRHMWRLFRAYERNPGTSALVRRKAGRKKGSLSLAPRLESIIDECIETHYLRAEAPSVASLVEAIFVRCSQQTAEEGGPINPPCESTVRLRIKMLKKALKLTRRKGAKAANQACEAKPGSVSVSRVLQRVEIDHTLIDVILRDDTSERKVVGRPWLTMAVDVASRMILGFYIGFERPSSSSVAMCLAMAALPKEDWLEKMNVTGSWPCRGISWEIWCDNALEFTAEALKRGCDGRTNLFFRPVGTPSYAGTIERLNGTMMGYCHLLPGTTFSNIKERGDYDSQKKAVMTLSEFIPWFTEQVVTQYHLRPHGGIGVTPLQKWNELVDASEIRMPRDPAEYYVSFLPARKRELTRQGVRLHNAHYWHEDMAPWVGEGQTVLVHYHQMDATTVYVRLPDGRVVPASGHHPYIQDLQGKTVADLKFRQGAIVAKAADSELRRIRTAGFLKAEERVEAAIALTGAAAKAVSRKRASAVRQSPLPVAPALIAPAPPAAMGIPARFEADLID